MGMMRFIGFFAYLAVSQGMLLFSNSRICQGDIGSVCTSRSAHMRSGTHGGAHAPRKGDGDDDDDDVDDVWCGGVLCVCVCVCVCGGQYLLGLYQP